MDVFDKMEKFWGSPFFVRSEVKRLTGGLVSPKTLANLAWSNEGPAFRKIRGRAVYDTAEFIVWLRNWADGTRKKKGDVLRLSQAGK